MLKGKDIVFELLEQSLIHENLDKIRRDLDEFSYKTKDASHLLNLPYINTNQSVDKPPLEQHAKVVETQIIPDAKSQAVSVRASVSKEQPRQELIKLQ